MSSSNVTPPNGQIKAERYAKSEPDLREGPPRIVVTNDLGIMVKPPIGHGKKKKKKRDGTRRQSKQVSQQDQLQQQINEIEMGSVDKLKQKERKDSVKQQFEFDKSIQQQSSYINQEGGTQSYKPKTLDQEISSRGQSIDSDQGPLVKGYDNDNNFKKSGTMTTPGADPNEYESLVLIMTKSEFDKVQEEYDQIKIQQRKCGYRTRRWFSTNIITKWFCCCISVKDRTDLDWDELTPIQRKHRIKLLWKKAKRVFLFQRLKLADEKFKKKKEQNHEEDGDDILENIGNQNEHEWKWWIIRRQNALPTFWQVLTNFLTIYALFMTPFLVVFTEYSDNFSSFELTIDIIFTIDILLEFVKLHANQKESDFRQIRISYLKSAFIFDCIAALPGLLTLEKLGTNINKIARFYHWNRFFVQLNEIVEGLLMGGLGYTRQKVSEYVDFIRLQITIVLITHVMACIWILIGYSDQDGWVNNFVADQKAATGDNSITKINYWSDIYANAFYFILTTITTVGYGDLGGNTTIELLFSMIVEFVGLTFFSFLTGTISVMFSGDQSFESLINARMEQLDLWLLRLENCNKEEKIPNKLYHSIKEFIQDAFVYDYNLIIEEFNFYQELPAQIQNQISESLFKTFKNQFNNFFLNTDIGFQHQLIVNMYCRIYEPGKAIVQYGQKLNEMYFITRGTAILYDSKGVTPFLQLPCYSFFGEYQLMFDLRANFVVKVGGKEDFNTKTAKQERTFFLCVSQEIFKRLFDQFPKSKFVAQKRALERRKVFIEHLEKVEAFIDEKNKIIQKRLKKQQGINALKAVMTGEGGSNRPMKFNQKHEESKQSSSEQSSQKLSSQTSSQDDSDEDLSEEDSEIQRVGKSKGTSFENYEIQSMNEKSFNIKPISKDPELEAKEENMRKLMSFRKDELILPEDSNDDDSDAVPQTDTREKNIQGIEDANELVDTIEIQMKNISQVIKGMDKRMSYNLRLIGSVVIENEYKKDLKKEGSNEDDDLINLVRKKSIFEKKEKIIPKIKKMADFTINKLEMNNQVDIKYIQSVKEKLKTIHVQEAGKQDRWRNLDNLVLDQGYMQTNPSPTKGQDNN